LPLPPRPEADPQAEYARLIDFARNAFAAGEYGRAAHAFRQASNVVPKDPFAHFLLAQALFALGKYADAVSAIHAGLELQPDWPKVRFRPIELYGPNVAEYAEHLRRLDEVVRQRPSDPILLFLYAYELWFDGRQEEARQFFQRAQPKAVHPGDIERFLRALPEAPVL
jgi:Flp pilus assembly protein TadD